MRKIILIVLVVTFISVFSWLNNSSSSSIEVKHGKVTEPVAQQAIIQQGTQTNRSTLMEENKKLLTKAKTTVNAKVEEAPLKESEALQVANTLLNNIFNNKTIDFSAEKALLSYLKSTNNEQVYQFIVEILQSANTGNDNDDRLLEYGLSLLAAIDSSRASELFYSFIVKDSWQGSNAIYTLRKSVSKLSRNPAYTGLVQQTFTNTDDENPFIDELASAIAYHAKAEQIDYLISYVDGDLQNKSSVVTSAMKKIQTESLVPHITGYISDDSTKNVQNIALNTLAYMGQYEAASALITWSSNQKKDSAKQVEELFSIALSRSPSTQKAIEKELHSKYFASEELKQLIINLSEKGR